MKKSAHACRLLLVLVIAPIFTASVFAQKEEAKKNEGSIGINMDKVDLLYKDVEVTQTTRSGMNFNYTTAWPYARINGGELKEIDIKGNVFAPYFNGCPSAKQELALYASHRRKAAASFWGGFLVGSGLGLAGLVGSVAADPEGAKGTGGTIFFTGIGLGFGSLITGVILSRHHSKRARTALDQSIINYNTLCYKPPSEDNKAPKPTNENTAPAPPVIAKSNPRSGITEHYKDTALIDVVRNAPDKMRLWAIGITPVNLDLRNLFSYRTGAEFVWQGPRFGLMGNVKYSLVDVPFSGAHKSIDDNPNFTFEQRDFAVPDDYQKGLQVNLEGSFKLAGKAKVKKERVFLGTGKSYGQTVDKVTDFEVKTFKTWNFHVGLQNFRTVTTTDPAPLITSEPDITVTDPSTGETFSYSQYDLSDCLVMMRGTILAGGISRRRAIDLRFDLLNTDVRGAKEKKGYIEWYIDALFAPSLELGRIDYYVYEPSPVSKHIRKNIGVEPTPLERFGVRLGVREYQFYKSSHGYFIEFEIGSKPGIKSQGAKGNNTYLELGVGYAFGKAKY